MTLLIYRVLAPFVVLALPFASPFVPKLRRGLALRRARREPLRLARRPVWIHASSGEFEYAKPVIHALKRHDPGVPVVVTYFSPTYADQIARFAGVDHAEPLPLDLPGPVAAFLARVDPAVALVARTDFWPELLTQTGRRGVPRVVFAYTQSPVAGLKRFFSRWQLGLVDQVRAVAALDADRARALRPDRAVTVAGDPRYDQVAARLANPKPLAPHLVPDGPAVVAGSTWAEDEAVLIPALAPLLRDGRAKLIVVPHEPTAAHLARLTDRLAAAGLTFALASEARAWSGERVLIVDQVGVLAELYALARVAFVGGSFRRRVHSVMEPLGAGKPTLVGPRHQNNREAADFAGVIVDGDLRAVTVVRDVAEFSRAVATWLTRDEDQTSRRILREFEQRRGAADALARAVLQKLPR